MSGANAVSFVGIVTMMSNCHRGITTFIIEVVHRCTAPHEHTRIDWNHGGLGLNLLAVGRCLDAILLLL